MVYRVLVEGKEVLIKKKLADDRRETDNITREEIIRHYLEEEGAEEVLFLESKEEVVL